MVASLPPPFTGQSLISVHLRKLLEQGQPVWFVDTRKSELASGRFETNRALAILRLACEIRRRRRGAACVYMILSQSRLGNVRDVLFLTVAGTRRCVVHLHGGGWGTEVYDRNRLLRYVNRSVLRGVKAALVLSEGLRSNFRGVIPDERIHVLENFAADEFRCTKDGVQAKFTGSSVLRIAYLSNMIESKGYRVLLDAFAGLCQERIASVRLEIAGAFSDHQSAVAFGAEMRDRPGVTYLGVLSGADRAAMLHRAHVFCLPTYYPYEGQPVSLLEACMSGCYIITTRQGGIPDVFREGVGGMFVERRSVEDLRRALEAVCRMDREELCSIAQRNKGVAEETFSRRRFASRVAELFGKIGCT